MNENQIRDLIEKIEMDLVNLPSGCVTCKMIGGKQRYYHQYYVDKRRKDRIIPFEEVGELKARIEKRNELKEQLKKLKEQLPKTKIYKSVNLSTMPIYECNVIIGDELNKMVTNVSLWQRRDDYYKLQEYLFSDPNDRVCVLFGLRRTGKSTMLRQAVYDMCDEDKLKTAYIKLQTNDTIVKLDKDLRLLSRQGYKYILIDEVTLANDFIDCASLFSDVYAAKGMKIVLSGTDSLGFWFAENEELYDRVKPNIHTTYISFKEFSRLLRIDDIDEYIRYGGTLRVGDLAFNNEISYDEASFVDDESTRKYIDTAICKNIQHSLKFYDNGSRLDWLKELYQENELTGAINRVIEDVNHRFVLSVLNDDFKSHDLGESANNLRKERDETKRTNSLDMVDKDTITKKLMEILEIKNVKDRKIEICENDVEIIKGYLKALELIIDCPIERGQPNLTSKEHILFIQPGMRYCQAQALLYVLFQDEYFLELDERLKVIIQEKILEDVRGRMLEDIVLIDTFKALNRDLFKVFKLQFERGEFDMVIYNKKEHSCSIYEIKHSCKAVKEQTKNLLNEEMVNLTENRFGNIDGKYVLYRGPNLDDENGVKYLNVSEYLKNLPSNIYNK